MARARVTMKKVRSIIRLYAQGNLSQRMISGATGVSRPVVAYYLGLFEHSRMSVAEVEAANDEELQARLRPSEARVDPRYEAFALLLPKISQELGRPGVTRQLLWEEYRAAHPDGYSYTQFCFHLQAFTETGELAMHLEHQAGKRLFIDFAGSKARLTDANGGEREVELFVAVFPASGLLYCEATENQRIDCLVPATRHSLEYAQGCPQIIVPDNLKAAVTTASRYEPQLNDTFEDFATHYGCAVIPARVRHPRDKALVEAAVNRVYQRILAPLRDRRFGSLDDLNEAIAERLELLNDQPMQRIGISRWERFRCIEQPLLKALPADAYEIRQFREATVAFNYHVYFSPDKHYYSVPWTYRRKIVRIVSTDRSVEVFCNHDRIAAHRRDRSPGGYSTQVEHMPSQHRMYAEWSPQRLLNWAQNTGPQMSALIATVLESRQLPEQSFRTCLGILKLNDRYGQRRLEAAASRAVIYGVTTYRGVRSILEKGLDGLTVERTAASFVLPQHANIRGEHYYEEVACGDGHE
jgi:transposase